MGQNKDLQAVYALKTLMHIRRALLSALQEIGYRGTLSPTFQQGML